MTIKLYLLLLHIINIPRVAYRRLRLKKLVAERNPQKHLRINLLLAFIKTLYWIGYTILLLLLLLSLLFFLLWLIGGILGANDNIYCGC